MAAHGRKFCSNSGRTVNNCSCAELTLPCDAPVFLREAGALLPGGLFAYGNIGCDGDLFTQGDLFVQGGITINSVGDVGATLQTGMKVRAPQLVTMTLTPRTAVVSERRAL